MRKLLKFQSFSVLLDVLFFRCFCSEWIKCCLDFLLMMGCFCFIENRLFCKE